MVATKPCVTMTLTHHEYMRSMLPTDPRLPRLPLLLPLSNQIKLNMLYLILRLHLTTMRRGQLLASTSLVNPLPLRQHRDTLSKLGETIMMVVWRLRVAHGRVEVILAAAPLVVAPPATITPPHRPCTLLHQPTPQWINRGLTTMLPGTLTGDREGIRLLQYIK